MKEVIIPTIVCILVILGGIYIWRATKFNKNLPQKWKGNAICHMRGIGENCVGFFVKFVFIR
jgi:hypothetical protein